MKIATAIVIPLILLEGLVAGTEPEDTTPKMDIEEQVRSETRDSSPLTLNSPLTISDYTCCQKCTRKMTRGI